MSKRQHIYEAEAVIRLNVHVTGTLRQFEEPGITRQALNRAIEMEVANLMQTERVDVNEFTVRFIRPKNAGEAKTPDITVDMDSMLRHVVFGEDDE